jgi:hypothetical protein
MRYREHPHPDLLLRFFQGETSKTENRAIVRHLLAGCRQCTTTTRPLWRLSDGRGWGILGLHRVRGGRTDTPARRGQV